MGVIMNLTAECKECKDKIPINPTKNNRTALSKVIGVTFKKRCPHCGVEKEYHIKDVTAKMRRVPIILFGIASFGYAACLYVMILAGMASSGKDGISIALPIVVALFVFPPVYKMYYAFENDFNYNKYERNKWRDE